MRGNHLHVLQLQLLYATMQYEYNFTKSNYLLVAILIYINYGRIDGFPIEIKSKYSLMQINETNFLGWKPHGNIIGVL